MRFRFAVVFLVAVFMSLASFAEGAELFTPSYLPYSMEQGDGKVMTWDKTFKKVEVVKFNVNVLFQEGIYFQPEKYSAEEVSFQVEGITYRASREKFEYRAEGNYSWFGYVEGSGFLSHFAVLDGKVAGEIWLPTNTPGGFQRSLISRGGLTFLAQYNQKEIGENLSDDQMDISASLKKELENLATQERRRGVRRPSPCGPGEVLTQQVDLMYVYDETSLEWFSKPETAESELRVLLQSAADDINATIFNSKAGDYRVNLVRMEKVKYVAAGKSGGLLSADWQWMANSPEVATLRNTYKADVVGLWVGVSADGSLGLAAGLGNGDPNRAYHVIMTGGGVVVSRHELGHNLGMGHQPEDWSDPNPAWAVGHYANLHFRDAISIYRSDMCPNFCDPVPVFSNPSVTVDGIPTGIKDQRENWRMVGIAFPIVSKYRDGSKSVCIAKGGNTKSLSVD